MIPTVPPIHPLPDLQPALLDLVGDLSLCTRCGACKTACPTYLVDLQESRSARGRLVLSEGAITGRLPWLDEALIDDLFSCLDCKDCETRCPSGVRLTKIFQGVREEMVLRGRQSGSAPDGLAACHPLVGRVIPFLLTRPRLMGAAMRLAGPLRLMLERWGWLGRWVGRGRRVWPQVGGPMLQQGYPSVIQLTDRRQNCIGRIAFFVGCATAFWEQTTGRNTIALLTRLGYEVVLPDEVCCGTPARALGDRAAQEKMARLNVQQMADLKVDAIVAICASCGHSLKGYGDLLGDEASKAFSSKVLDIHQFLVDRVDLPGLIASGQVEVTPIQERITWHDPCHLARAQGVVRQPRQLLDAVAPNWVDLPDAGRCCGSGGARMFTEYHHADALRQSKVTSIVSSGVDGVVTGCPACRLHLEDGLGFEGRNAGNAQQLVDVLLQAVQPGGKWHGSC
ncbi:MAG: hypothetical protein COX57_03425 [Alphaproteobacteria bacterium CG_4_10_14_0_2_um_filter_63_37]|nr:MAG: hypothetical protein AUJ55_05670 [Proteobacteria bacterium CG1_02_64_396]PJA25453.1 MAG: hypothetical protein COX57_03425 [Alphaproteobacteria bacterium CG_4_10_14_0_2_um_filter_63_37]